MGFLSAYSINIMNIRITQRTNNPTKTGKSPLFLRFTHNRQSKFISLKVAILPEYWNSTTQTISANCPKYEELQNQINNNLAQYKRKALKLEVLETKKNLL